MKLTLKAATVILSRHGITEKELVKSIHKDLSDVLDGTEAVRPFIQAYCDAFAARWGTDPIINGRLAGTAKRIVKDIGLTRAIHLVQEFLKMDDAFFVIRRHDLVTFEQNLNAVNVKAETGQTVTQSQAKRKEAGNANTTAIRSYLEKRRNDE